MNTGVVLRCTGEAGIGVESDAALTERTLEVLGNCLVFVICKVGERLDDCDFRAEGTPDGSKLKANDAAAQYDGLLWYPFHLKGLIRGDDAARNIQAGD